jgi:hypothetical protein
VVEVPAREADDDDVHDEVQHHQRRQHVPPNSCHCRRPRTFDRSREALERA